MIIGIDFDGTIVKHEYPQIGQPVPEAFRVIKGLLGVGHKLILHTMRSGKELEEAVHVLKINGIEFYGINENPSQKTWTTSPKPYCQVYIDDTALGCPLIEGDHALPYVDWLKVEELLSKKTILTFGIE